MGDYYHANRDVSEKTEKLGQLVSVRNIQRYRSSRSIPQFATARLLIEAAGGSIDAETLKTSLRLERALQKKELGETETLTVKITNEMINTKLNIKNLPAMWETWVQSLGWGDPLEKGMATQSSILAWRIS